MKEEGLLCKKDSSDIPMITELDVSHNQIMTGTIVDLDIRGTVEPAEKGRTGIVSSGTVMWWFKKIEIAIHPSKDSMCIFSKGNLNKTIRVCSFELSIKRGGWETIETLDWT